MVAHLIDRLRYAAPPGAIALVLVAGIPPVAHSQPGLDQAFSDAGGPYVGEWMAHGERLIVGSDGNGSQTSTYGTIDFRMDRLMNQDGTAYGNVVSGGRAGRGSYVTMQLVDGGRGLLLSIAQADNNFPFCKMVNGNAANSADCGA